MRDMWSCRLRRSAAGFALALALPIAKAQPLSFTPFHPSGIYELGEKAGWTVVLPQGAAATHTKYAYTIQKNNSDLIQTGMLDLSSGKAVLETTLNEPAMLYVEVRSSEPAPSAPIHLGAAIAPAFDVDSHDLAPDQAAGVSTNYQAIGNTDRETSYFLNMYLRDARAIDYLASRPDWDGKTLVVMGTSMGGQQSLVAAALHPKVTAVMVNEPAGADSNGDRHGRKAGYPNWPSGDAKVMETALYFDTVNFASRIHAPVLAAIGFIDTIAPPVGIWTAIDQVPGPKEVIPMVESDHNNITPEKQGAWLSRSKEVLDMLLHGGVFAPNEPLTRAGVR